MSITHLNAEMNNGGHLTQNIIYFARSLRRAGLKLGPAEVQNAIRAVAAVGFTGRQDFFVTLRACFVSRAEDLAIFEQSYNIFWRDPEFIETMMQALMPMLEADTGPKKTEAAQRRAQEALMDDIQAPPRQQRERDEISIDSSFSFSNDEKLGSQDFEQMSAAELKAAETALRNLHLPIAPRPSRRFQPAATGQINPRAAFHAARRRGGEILELPKKAPRQKLPRLVILTDISGSMSQYSRMMLLFAHALMTNAQRNFSELHTFTFGTRLTNISRKLAIKDPDAALEAIGRMVQDWDGGTAIGESLERFNKDWSRRVLGTDAVVILVSDGLERGDNTQLANAAQRLTMSARAVIWMNPLLRYDAFAPEAGGVKALLPHVSHFIGAHNLNSFGDLAALIGAAQTTRAAA